MTENVDVSSETPPEAEPSAATVARDQLLSAIGREAVHLFENQPGNASGALLELSRAYVTVVAGPQRLSERNLSAYMFFSQYIRDQVVSDNPTAAFGEIGR